MSRVQSASFPVWGGTATLAVCGMGPVDRALRLLRAELSDIDRAVSRFRADSELNVLPPGSAVMVSPLLAEAVEVALRAAELTDGLVDPTVGRALVELGYDRDFAALPADGAGVRPARPEPVPGWWRLGWDAGTRSLLVPHGVLLDLGATAKAFAADRSAARIVDALGGGALVALGGDVAVAGDVPSGGWRVAVGEDHSRPDPAGDTAVTVSAGGVATSGTTRRRWRQGGTVRHHIIDPRTGTPAAEVWRTVTVAAGTCVDANIASTAAVVLGAAAPEWLARRALPARLVAADGAVELVAGWPAGETGAAA